MDEVIRCILGKTIRSIVVSESNENSEPTLLFLVFDDGTSFGFNGRISTLPTGMDKGGEKSAVEYVHKFNKRKPQIYSLESLERNQNYKGKSLDLAELTHSLISFGMTLPTNALFPTVIEDAADIIVHDPYAFCIASCLDRGTKADIIWTIPYDIKKELGHLDPIQINQMSEDELATLFKRLPRRPRYIHDAPKTIKELTRIVVENCGGDASQIWIGKKAAQVHQIFDSIHGVGPGIASMVVLLIEKAFDIRFEDRENMDIKPDVHTVRVLYRLGISDAITTEAALNASRRMNPEFPGKVDGALWEIGRRWCRPTFPDCLACPVSVMCEKRL